MDKGLIYICYDPFDYVNCYSLAINGEVVCEIVPEERIVELFEKCDELGISKTNTQWCIVRDENAIDWNYEEVLKSYGYDINPMTISENELCEKMKKLFDKEFIINNNSNTEKKVINILYPCITAIYTSVPDAEKAVGHAEDILNKAGMTELACIIREKYERMNKHE